jgi:hypothetical protein
MADVMRLLQKKADALRAGRSTQKTLGPAFARVTAGTMAQANAVFLKGNLFRHISVMSLTSSVGSDGRVSSSISWT